jgi:hypothetical protein
MPNIEQEAEELRAKLTAGEDTADDAAAEVKAEVKTEVKTEEKAGEQEEEAEETEAVDEAATDENGEEKKVVEEKPAGNTEAARKRREAAEARRKAQEKPAEEKNTKADVKPQDEDPEPEDKDSVAHAKWENRQLRKDLGNLTEKVTKPDPDVEAVKRDRQINAAQSEFNGFMGKLKSEHPDTEAVIEHVANRIYGAIRDQNPGVPHEKLVESTRLQLLVMARDALAKGYENPVARLYDLGFEHYGYAPKAEEKPAEEKTPEAKKQDLGKLEEVKKKSTSASTAGGRSTKAKHLPDIDKLSPAEFEKLSAEEMRELLDAA